MVFIGRSNSMDLEGNTTSNKFRLSLSNQITIGILRREKRESKEKERLCIQSTCNYMRRNLVCKDCLTVNDELVQIAGLNSYLTKLPWTIWLRGLLWSTRVYYAISDEQENTFTRYCVPWTEVMYRWMNGDEFYGWFFEKNYCREMCWRDIVRMKFFLLFFFLKFYYGIFM